MASITAGGTCACIIYLGPACLHACLCVRSGTTLHASVDTVHTRPCTPYIIATTCMASDSEASYRLVLCAQIATVNLLNQAVYNMHADMLTRTPSRGIVMLHNIDTSSQPRHAIYCRIPKCLQQTQAFSASGTGTSSLTPEFTLYATLLNQVLPLSTRS